MEAVDSSSMARTDLTAKCLAEKYFYFDKMLILNCLSPKALEEFRKWMWMQHDGDNAIYLDNRVFVYVPDLENREFLFVLAEAYRYCPRSLGSHVFQQRLTMPVRSVPSLSSTSGNLSPVQAVPLGNIHVG